MEHTNVEHENSKPTPSQDDNDHTQTTPPPPKKRYEIMKDPIVTDIPSFNTFKTFNLHESRRSFDPTSFYWRFRL